MEDKLFMHRFWEEHPDADAIPAFKALRSKRGDEASSRLMWYLSFLNDPEHEYIHQLPRKDREELLKDYCSIKKSDLDSKLFQEADKWFQNNWMTAVKQVYTAFHEKIFQARDTIRTGNIFAPEDITTYHQALKSFNLFVVDLQATENQLKSEVKASRAAKMFGKDEMVRPVDSGTFFK